MSDYDNRPKTAHETLARAPGSGTSIYWILGIALVVVLSILLFAGGAPGPSDGLESVPAPAAVPDTTSPETTAPGLPPAPQQ